MIHIFDVKFHEILIRIIWVFWPYNFLHSLNNLIIQEKYAFLSWYYYVDIITLEDPPVGRGLVDSLESATRGAIGLDSDPEIEVALSLEVASASNFELFSAAFS